MTDAVTKLKDNGNLYYKSQEYKKARDCYLKCIELKPEEALYHYNTSMANFQLQKYEESLANCEKAVELDPKYKKAYFRKVQCNLKLGNSLQAIIDGKKYLSLEGAEPQDSQIRQAISQLKAKLLQTSPATIPNPTLYTHKHSVLPPHITQIPSTLAHDPVGILYLQQLLGMVSAECTMPYLTAQFSQLEQIKKLIYKRLLEVETDQNKVEILQILCNMVTDKAEREKMLEQRISIAQSRGWDEKALIALREISLLTDDNKKVQQRINQIKVTDNINSQESEQEEEKISNQMVTSTKFGEQSSKSLPIKKSIDVEQVTVGNPQQTNKKQPNQPKPPIKNPQPPKPKTQLPASEAPKSQPLSSSSELDSLQNNINQKLVSLSKSAKFKEFIDVIEKIEEVPLAKREEILLRLSKISGLSLILKGLNKAQQMQLDRVTADLPSEMKKLYNP